MTTTFSQTVLSPWLTPVRLISSSNVSGTYFNGQNNNGVGATLTVAASSLTVDSVVANVGDRILLTAQSSTLQNGIYVVSSIASTVVLTRAEDMQSVEQMKAGLYTVAGAGSVHAGNLFTLIEPLPSNIGVDAITFSADANSGGVSFSGPASTANALAVFSDTAGDLKAQSTASTLGFGLTITTGNFAVSAGTMTSSGAITGTAGALTSGASTGGFVGLVKAFPTTATSGFIALQGAVNGSGNFGTTISNATTQGQAQVVTIPNAGAATANFVLDAGTATSLTVTKISTGATPIALVDPGSCTITAAAGAANTSTVTVQLKDGSGTNINYSSPFKVYSSSASNGLTLQGAASTGYSVASGGLSLANGTAVTTQISCISSATGGCVLSLLDTGKQTSYLVLVVEGGIKISAQLSAGSYG